MGALSHSLFADLIGLKDFGICYRANLLSHSLFTRLISCLRFRMVCDRISHCGKRGGIPCTPLKPKGLK